MTQPNKEKPQSDKFKRAARDLGCDEDEAAFDRGLKQMKKQPEKADKAKKGQD